MTGLSGKGGLELPLVPVGGLEELGDLTHLRHHQYPISTLTVTVAEVKLGNPGVGEAHTAIPRSDNDAQHKTAISVSRAGREFVLAASPSPSGGDGLIAVEGPKGPVSHLEVGWVVGGEMDDGNIRDGEGVSHTLLIPEPAGQEVSVVPTDEGHVVRGIGLVYSKYLKHPNH